MWFELSLAVVAKRVQLSVAVIRTGLQTSARFVFEPGKGQGHDRLRSSSKSVQSSLSPSNLPLIQSFEMATEMPTFKLVLVSNDPRQCACVQQGSPVDRVVVNYPGRRRRNRQDHLRQARKLIHRSYEQPPLGCSTTVCEVERWRVCWLTAPALFSSLRTAPDCQYYNSPHCSLACFVHPSTCLADP